MLIYCCMIVDMKTCTHCGNEKELSEFTKATGRKDSLNPWCKTCTRENCKKADLDKTRERSAKWYQENKARRRATVKEWLANNPGKSAEYGARWRTKYPEKSASANRTWYANNKAKKLAANKRRREANLQKFLTRERASYARNKATALLKNANWRKRNAPAVAAHAAKRRSAKAERTPPWLSNSQHEEILKFYIDAARLTDDTGTVYHVDHIVPLRGKTVSGLHVPWNMQILIGTDNLKKSNRHEA